MLKQTNTSSTKQSGYLLLEVLVSILIFSTGILAIFSLQAVSIQNSSDAKYRADASFLANQIVGHMWGDRANLAAYEHHPTTGSACTFTGSASGNANVSSWADEINGTSGVNGILPGADASRQQIKVDTANNTVTVTVCWKAPQESTYHSYTTIAQING